jgi:uncharacterized Zn-binding protein involved in type VI secretion
VAKECIRKWLLVAAVGLWWMCGAAVANERPTARAGSDQTTQSGTTAILDGSASVDVDGDPLTFLWSVLEVPAGVSVHISDATLVRPDVVLPAPGTYRFQLIVSDGTANGDPDIVTLTTFNSSPVAHAGPDRSVAVGSRVVLDGSRSTDVDGDALTYEWALTEKPGHSGATLLNGDPASPMADFIVDQPGRYIAHLIVRDAESTSAADATIVSTDNSTPEANAGHDLAASVGEWVGISGAASADADDDALSYRWSLVKPAGSAAVLSATAGVATGFAPDVPGSYVVQLIVNDGQHDSVPDTIAISTENSRPYAYAFTPGSGRGYVGEETGLNGYYSYDPDDDPITYSWSVLSGPVGSNATLLYANEPYAGLVPDLPGMYVVQLIVNDGVLDSEPATTQVEALIRPPPEEPVIVVDQLPDFVNTTPVLLTGSVSEAATLWINGEVVPLDGNNRFSHQLSLSEGWNEIEFQAADAQNHWGYAYRTISLDTQPPAPPQLARIAVQAQPGGRLIVRGNTEAVEGGALVRITNLRTNETVSVQANSNGDFQAELGGIESDELSILALDAAQNQGPPTVIPGIGSGPLRIEILAPLDGANVTSSAVLVRGALYGPVDAGVSVNGEAAVVLENGPTRTFSALVKLQSGSNDIVAMARRPDGSTATDQAQVMNTTTAAFVVMASPAAGPPPLNVTFEIHEFTEQKIARIDIDLQGDGVIDITNTKDDRYIPATYAQAGYYEAVVTITTGSNQIETTVVPISVQTTTQLNLQLQRVWAAIGAGLRASDVPAVLAHFTAEAADRYEPVLQQIGTGLPSLADAFTEITVARVSGAIVECLLIRNINGTDQGFLVTFVRGGDGVWRVASL